MKGLHSQLFSKPGFHVKGCVCDNCLNPNTDTVDVSEVILDFLLKHPSGARFSRIWRRVNSYPHYTLKETEQSLMMLVRSGRLACTNGIYYVRDNPNGKAE